MNKRLPIIILLGLLVIAIVIIFLLRSCNDSEPPNKENPITTSSTLDFKAYVDYKDESISIPGMTGLDFKAGQLKQVVDFYNPENNPCYFVISLYLSDGTLIYQSDYLAPSEHINEINLKQTLQRGLYGNCRLLYNCYSLDTKAKLNGGEVKLEINSQ